MLLLAIDTALDACSVAVADGARVLASETEVIGRGHAERLVGMIETVMASSRRSFTDLGRIAVTIGPGSFTGIRVGLAAARGLALAAGKPVVGIATLDCLARQAPETGRPLLVAFDARRGECYARAFGSDREPLSGPAVLTLDAAADLASALGADLYGSGAALIAAAAADAGLTVAGDTAYPDIAIVAALGAEAAPRPVPPKPLYLRAPDAKPQTAGVIARAPLTAAEGVA